MRPDLRDFKIVDRIMEGINDLTCSVCNVRLYPDCDLSAASIVEEFELHLVEDHGFTRRQINAFLRKEAQ